MLDGDAVTSITPQPTLVDNNCLGRNNDRFVSPSCAREVMAKLTRRRAIYAHASAGDTREPANTPHRSSAGRLACAKTQRRNLVSLSWIRFSPTLYNMAVSVCSHTFFPERSGSRPTPKILVFAPLLHALPLKFLNARRKSPNRAYQPPQPPWRLELETTTPFIGPRGHL